jgi:hypothetical protein
LGNNAIWTGIGTFLANQQKKDCRPNMLSNTTNNPLQVPQQTRITTMALSPLLLATFLQDDDLLTSIQVCLLSYACWLFFPNPRGPSFFEQRLAWQHYHDKHQEKGTLKRRLRMDGSSFNKLLGYVYDSLMVKEVMANSRGGPIIPELCLFCTLRYLAGGSYLDICDIAGVSASSFTE